MNIFTSSWFTPLPLEIQKIGISRGTPRGYAAGYRKMPELAPGPWFNSVNVREYKQRFFAILDDLDPRSVVRKIEDLSAGRDAALLCYEDPRRLDQWCHRGYVSAWLHDHLGLQVFEYGHQERGFGWQHPMIPPEYRRVEGPQATPPLDVTPYIGADAKDDQGRIWQVVGFDTSNPDQAVIASGEDRRSISGDVLRSRFKLVM